VEIVAQASLGRAQWTANDVALAFRGLGILPSLPSPQELTAEGFVGPVDITLWYGSPQQAQAEEFLEQQRLADPDATGALPVTAPWYSPWQLYPTQTDGINVGRAFLRITLAIGMLVALAWALWFVVEVAAEYGPF
jgi:hypothetical protein